MKRMMTVLSALALVGCGYNSSDVSVETIHREGVFQANTLGDIKRVEDRKHGVYFYTIVTAWGEIPVGSPIPMEKETAGK